MATENSPFQNQSALHLTLDIIEQIEKAGLVLTPASPSETMLSAGVNVSGMSPEQVLKIYRAMVASKD